MHWGEFCLYLTCCPLCECRPVNEARAARSLPLLEVCRVLTCFLLRGCVHLLAYKIPPVLISLYEVQVSPSVFLIHLEGGTTFVFTLAGLQTFLQLLKAGELPLWDLWPPVFLSSLSCIVFTFCVMLYIQLRNLRLHAGGRLSGLP